MKLSPNILKHLLFSLLCFAISLPAGSTVKDQKQSELKLLQSKIKRLQTTITVKQDSKNQYVKQLRNIEKNIGSLNKNIKKSNISIKLSNKRLIRLNIESKKLKTSLKKNNARLEKQIYGAYVQGQHSQLQMIFNQKDPAQFQRQLMFYQYVAKQQSDIIKAVNQNIIDLQQTQLLIKQEKTQLASTKQTFIDQKKQLSKDRNKRKKIVLTLNKQLKKQGKYLDSLTEDANQLKQLIASINDIFKDSAPPKKPFRQLKGKLPWPLTGKLKTMYGHLKPLSNLKWKGHIIYARQGQHVRSIASGVIAYADWLKGFGNLIIINHGDGYLSLYSHNQSLFKAPGEEVAKGEIIGSAGNSGGLQKSGIYFEIRKQGKPQNPSIWCSRKNKFIS